MCSEKRRNGVLSCPCVLLSLCPAALPLPPPALSVSREARGGAVTIVGDQAIGPARIYEGALLFVTEISCNHRDSLYKGYWRGTITEGPRLSRP